ncbi:hypothetical protein PAAG_05003 [Paracoccidioides lutzii Pb01]|uniref:Uncharacterized protein n=1 Tax=Paracoccidioides lutzii (strain ATCC MYA-826 / Pb01) TaxID=502779 RepID=C1H2L0_PARBA|nr:hypothetical protein PAAG_05003 [Paracoccidioides lutzii Pb01]EEH33954.2 hypothetical protein PAAG_05003 [Paracoccidioides lutzii Pb01]
MFAFGVGNRKPNIIRRASNYFLGGWHNDSRGNKIANPAGDTWAINLGLCPCAARRALGFLVRWFEGALYIFPYEFLLPSGSFHFDIYVCPSCSTLSHVPSPPTSLLQKKSSFPPRNSVVFLAVTDGKDIDILHDIHLQHAFFMISFESVIVEEVSESQDVELIVLFRAATGRFSDQTAPVIDFRGPLTRAACAKLAPIGSYGLSITP